MASIDAILSEDHLVEPDPALGARKEGAKPSPEAIEPASVDPAYREPIETILTQGPLARRILRVLDGATGRRQLAHVYRRLCDCLACDELFVAGA